MRGSRKFSQGGGGGGGGPNSQKVYGKFQHGKIIWQFQGGGGSGPPVPPSGSAHG